MAIEKITEEQKKKSEEASKESNKSLEQKIDEAKQDITSKVMQEYEKQKQNLGQQFDKMKKMWDDTLESFAGVTGYENPEDVDIDTIIEPIKAAIDPIVEVLAELGISIPGLSEMSTAISTAKSVSDKIGKVKKSDAKGQLTNKDRNLVEAVGHTATTIMISLSMCFINLIISAIAKILDILIKIATAFIDPDNLPYPLNLIPKLLAALPKIISLAVNLPTNLDVICKAIYSKFEGLIADAELPESIDDIKIPEKLAPTPEQEQQLADAITDTVMSKAKQYIPTTINI